MTNLSSDITLWNEDKMPIIGLGTWNNVSEEGVHAAVDAALKVGYRHIDTAYTYGNEAAIGRALKKWFDQGDVKREDLFIATKLPLQGMQPERVDKYLGRSLAALQLSYVDLYLVQFPCGCPEKGSDLLLPLDESGALIADPTTDHVAVWKAMERQVLAGRARSVGLSHFNARQLLRVAQAAQLRPACLQLELHAYCQQRELAAFCKGLELPVVACAPLSSPEFLQLADDPDSEMTCLPKISPLLDPVVAEIAHKHKKTPAQILLRHSVQRGIAVIPKSVNPARIKENFQIFDFELDEDDVWELDSIDRWNRGRVFDKKFFRGMESHPEFPFNDPY
ncbi:1,5-anhydro-D-fructose reductase-like [Bacillus rossius redtenbacheri]|uniref:1,5-anhydro-D-fructose reductase-like n=1 Tax=Bacillus rossius redtenbacheri TaxID=93214 RepID=UPI002FDCC07F